MALVYSTETGKLCPQCGQTAHKGPCPKNNTLVGDGKVRIGRETKGRKGAGVTVVNGIPLADTELKILLKQLKQLCGVGGSLKDGILELQGDQRDKLLKALANKGWDVKLRGS